MFLILGSGKKGWWRGCERWIYIAGFFHSFSVKLYFSYEGGVDKKVNIFVLFFTTDVGGFVRVIEKANWFCLHLFGGKSIAVPFWTELRGPKMEKQENQKKQNKFQPRLRSSQKTKGKIVDRSIRISGGLHQETDIRYLNDASTERETHPWNKTP